MSPPTEAMMSNMNGLEVGVTDRGYRLSDGARVRMTAAVFRGEQIIFDLDGNRYPSRAAKLAWLEWCWFTQTRSGNGKPITTLNQRRQLEERLLALRKACEIQE